MNEISRPAYYYWHRRLKDNDPEIPLQSFVKVPAETISVNKTTSTPELVVSWKGFTIKISDEESLPLAAELISMIGGQSC